MAVDCASSMSECALLEKGAGAFMSRRCDRRNNEKLHVQPLCGLQHLDFNIPSVSSYEQYFPHRVATQSRRRGPAASVAALRVQCHGAQLRTTHTMTCRYHGQAGTWVFRRYDMSSRTTGPGKWTGSIKCW